ncbi:hypothetical protein Syun_022383 [Stephania yunnanensis]|uniref:Inositol polyphosphate-related phosphatase domain-containing protein n=1 Tax=Stephania yunnanensis TaxID=152371 RepID=A0AAP0F9H9_9MAGN
MDEEDREPFAAAPPPRPHRKTQSYSHQLTTTTTTTASSLVQSRKMNVRKHSLDSMDGTSKKVESTRFLDGSDGEEEEEYEEFANTINGRGGGTELQSFFNDILEPQPEEVPEDQRKFLAEFVASGGGSGIFQVPVRAAMHPGRPPSLEVRPHPLRETQVGWFLRSIECTERQLWAGQERGVRVWEFSDLYEVGCGIEGRMRRGDEDAAPFTESAPTSPTLCLIVDAGNRFIWTGHKDGKIRSWKMDRGGAGGLEEEEGPLKDGFGWHAHRGPVLSMDISLYGDIWSGSEGGVVKVWPWEAIEKSLSLTVEERHMASLLVERSYVDLRSQVTFNGVCNISGSDVKYILSDNCRGKVWSAGYLSFALWDARTKELLKVFNIDGQIENRVDMTLLEASGEEEVKIKFASVSKKEKPQGFFQRSRNALMGAADAVRRVAAKGAFGDDYRRTEAIVMSMDGMIWTGCANGLLVQWDGNGGRIQDFHYHSSAVQCFCVFGSSIWVGYASGTIQVLDLEGRLLGGWVGHSGPIIKMAVGGGYVFSLANHGGVRGWSLASPGPIDNILRSELASKELMYTKLENLKILAGTWNVGQGRASHDSLISWLGSVASGVGIVVVGLQEVEMGAGFLAVSAAKETVGLEGSAMGQWWLDTIGRTLDEGTTFERVGSRQLAGLLISVWIRRTLKPHIGDVDAAAVPCGFGRAIGNKGAVGLRMRVYDRIICFVNCHFAAHLEAVNRRNADFDHVYRTMVFSRPSNLLNTAAAGVSSAVHMLRGTNAGAVHPDDAKPELSEADMVVFLGDFNYRLHGISYDEARDFVSQRCFDWLKERDQLRAEMVAGKVFQGMREGIIMFPPTYKFERHQAGLGGYDSGEKKRIPAWCDRILYRDNRSSSMSDCNLECPVVSSVTQYEACMDVTDSDHKPVRCVFNVDIARVDESIRRKEFGRIMDSNEKIRSILQELCFVPETIVSTNNIILQNNDPSILRITNKCGNDRAMFETVCDGQSAINEEGQASDPFPRAAFGLPPWLEVIPAVGMIKPGQVGEVSVRHEEFHTQLEFVDGVPQNSFCEDVRDKEVILVVTIRGSCSTEMRSHRVRVRQNFTSKKVDSKIRYSGKIPSNVLHRSDIQRLENTADVVEDLRRLNTP